LLVSGKQGKIGETIIKHRPDRFANKFAGTCQVWQAAVRRVKK
jgi:hypothetical protein